MDLDSDCNSNPRASQPCRTLNVVGSRDAPEFNDMNTLSKTIRDFTSTKSDNDQPVHLPARNDLPAELLQAISDNLPTPSAVSFTLCSRKVLEKLGNEVFKSVTPPPPYLLLPSSRA
jgi:hypothetical protein